MAISLGKDCSLTWDTVTVPGVRDVTVDTLGESIQIRPFASRATITHQTGYSLRMTIDTIDDAAATTAAAAVIAGTEIAVAATGYSFTAVVTSVTDAQPLDDVRGWQIVLEKTQSGLR